jgi:hypothetical protein
MRESCWKVKIGPKRAFRSVETGVGVEANRFCCERERQENGQAAAGGLPGWRIRRAWRLDFLTLLEGREERLKDEGGGMKPET